MMTRHVSAASQASVVETSGTSTTLDAFVYRFEASDAGMTLVSIPHRPEAPSPSGAELQL
jgi:hypothetical protein